MKKALSLLALFAAVGFLAMSQNTSSAASNTPMETHVVEVADIHDSILASGNFTFADQIELRSEVMGVVTKVLVDEGTFVRKGELLLELDKTQFAANVAQAKASVDIQAAEIKRLDEMATERERVRTQLATLAKAGTIDSETYAQAISHAKIAVIDLEAAQHRLVQLQALLAQHEINLNKTQFTAPLDGLVLNVGVKVGETVIAGSTNIVGSALMTLADTNTYVAQVRVDEADLANISRGQSVDLFAAALPNQALSGQITNVSTTAQRSNQGQGLHYQVEVTLASSEYLFPGMSCRAEILVQQQANALAVPIAAIQQQNGEHFVWVVDNQIAEKRKVSLGVSSDLQQVITTGIQPNERVIIGPSRQLNGLQPGHKVTLMEG
ncbi:efflux RND transporter periplasmic adaptor subunit [uncultured Ferrimonas sp.]|uniref:efflux RND transporter periplasmic adaptor subunit n=1 Tax=uncultured Ferrimonas sp. TaxID=432640 RepID=UPI00262C6DFF|nr:efflux RND transporter periplasmic adaptor subunit [uncultured Ferrimonas sp.]